MWLDDFILTIRLLLIFAAEWERRSQSNVLRTPSQTRRQADTVADHRPSSPTGLTRSQLTEAQVETYPMKSYTQMGMESRESGPMHLNQDSSQSASPGGTWSSPYHNNSHSSSHAREADRARARQDGHSSGKLSSAIYLAILPLFRLLLFVLRTLLILPSVFRLGPRAPPRPVFTYTYMLS